MVRTLTFLLGAGASRPLDIPTTKEMATEFLAITKNKLLGRIPKENLEDVEKLISVTQRIVDLKNNEGVALLRGSEPITRTSNQLQVSDVWKEFEDTARELRDYIRKKCNNPNVEKATALYGPLLELHKKNARISIFSTNYDTAIESVCKKNNIPLTDGFKLKQGDEYYRFDPSAFLEGEAKGNVLLFKLHGSVNWWSRDSRQDVFKISLELEHVENIENLMIYPARKEDVFNFPYNVLQSAFIIKLHNVNDLIAIGHKFRDPNVLSAVKVALDRPDFRLTLVNIEAESIKREVFGNHERVIAIEKPIEEWIGKGIEILMDNIDKEETKQKSQEKKLWSVEEFHAYPSTFGLGSMHREGKLKCPKCGNMQNISTTSFMGYLMCNNCRQTSQYSLPS